MSPEGWTVRSEQGRTACWRNGNGTTRELVRVPEGDDWKWRLAVATSTTAAPFSAFPGVDRELLLLHGDALELRFRGGATTRLTPGERTRFAGENAVVGMPTSGATEQLNLMWRRDLVAAHTLAARVGCTLSGPATWLVVHVLEGSVRHPLGAGRLGPGDTVIITSAGAVTLHGDGLIYCARLVERDG